MAVAAPTRDCEGCGFTLSLFAFPRRYNKRGRYCLDCLDAAGKDIPALAREVERALRAYSAHLLARFGYTRAAQQVWAGGSWPNAREARLMQIPKQRRPA